MARELTEDRDLEAALRAARTVAVIGAHREPRRAAYYVPEYLRDAGYRVLPVNPRLLGEALFGEPVVARVTDLTEPVDLVDVFRRSDAVRDHVDEILAMRPRPSVVWLQLGVRDDAAAARLVAAGIDVVQDRCTLADHERLIASSPT